MATYDPNKTSQELWESVKGYDDYFVSNFGRVKSLKFNKEKIFDPKSVKYYYISLYKEGVKQNKSIHVMVAEAFLDFDSLNKRNLVVDHIDGNIHNNHVDNLQIITQRFNTTKGNMTNKSGHVGVCWKESRKSWRVKILYNNKRIILGSFKDKEEAIKLHKQFLNDIESNKFFLSDYIERREKRKQIKPITFKN